MPNWCLNRLDVEGDPSEVERFFRENSKGNENEPLSFAASVPVAGTDIDHYYNAWGTKWDACDARFVFNGEGVWADEKSVVKHIRQNEPFGYFFETAWAPPMAWLSQIGVKYPGLRFVLSFAEPGCDFCGEHIVQGEDNEVWEGTIDYLFTENRGLLEWPRCCDCSKHLSEESVNEGNCYCPECEENDFMKRGAPA